MNYEAFFIFKSTIHPAVFRRPNEKWDLANLYPGSEQANMFT